LLFPKASIFVKRLCFRSWNVFVQAAITKCQRLNEFFKKDIISTVLDAQKSMVMEPKDLVLGEDSPPGLRWALLQCDLMTTSFYLNVTEKGRERERDRQS
jgi:hypothetical protein